MKFLKFIFVFVVISSMIFSVEYSKTVNLPNADGQTPLSIAVEEKNIEKIKSLINKKMDPNSKLNEFGETLLMWACRNSQKELAFDVFKMFYDTFVSKFKNFCGQSVKEIPVVRN